jgi:D-alanine-D-alanine ligase
MKLRVGVLFGGRSGEHEVAIRSARTVIEQLDPEKYEPLPIAISKEGRWLSPADSLKLFPESTRSLYAERYGEPEAVRFGLLGETGVGGVVEICEKCGNACCGEVRRLDVVFPVLHGTFGEDGTVQGLLEMADIPYVGCGVLASSSGMDKVVMKALFREAGLSICDYLWFLRSEWESDPDEVLCRAEERLGFPMFVKPANLGSSVGISRAEAAEELRKAIDLAAQYDRKIIVEEALEMREIECAVIGNDNPTASEPGEYIIRDESKAFLDYTEKYAGTGNNEFVVPSPITPEQRDAVRETAIRAFKAIDGSGLARVDFFLRKDNGELLLNEINTMPGLTDASGFPKMWEGSGKPFRAVLDEVIQLALERARDRKRNKTHL